MSKENHLHDLDSRDGGTIAPIPRISIQAFCESAELAQTIEEAARDRRMCKAHIKAQMGGVVAAIEAYQSAPTPNLIVIETMASRSKLFSQLDKLATICDQGTKVVVIGNENDITLFRELLAFGISDYLVAPLRALDVIKHISQLYNGQSSESIGRVISVVGAKGGVGSSIIAHNLAWSISRQFDAQTVIGDLDLPFGTTALNFNQDPPQGVAEAIFSSNRIDAAFVDRLMSKCGDRLGILAAPAALTRSYDLQEEALDPILEILSANVPCTILDVPHGWSGWIKRVLVRSEEVVIVACPDLANLRNAKILMEALRADRPNDRPPRLALNMVGVPRRPEISVGEFAKAISLDPSSVIPYEPRLFGVASNNGQMLDEVDKASKVVETIDLLARELSGRSVPRKLKRAFIPSLMERIVTRKAS